MRPVFETSSYPPTHPSSDVYSYNFPNDRRPVKFIGWSLISFGSSGVLRRTLRSLFRLLVGDCSDCTLWLRCLLLVYCWIWQRGTPRTFPFRRHRRWLYDGTHFCHRSRILLLPNLGAEQQTAVVDVLDNCCCMYI
jgi:hypothetical protein